jgi:sec-independent protein translocase protein TatA
MPNLGAGEIVLLVLVALLLFGAKRLPEIGRSLGTGMREFKESLSSRDPGAIPNQNDEYVAPEPDHWE